MAQSEQPTNLRIANYHRKGLGCSVIFDGPKFNGYDIRIRSHPTHGHHPLVDDTQGTWQWVDDPNGREVKRVNREWVRNPDGSYVKGRYDRVIRRTWTSYMGADAATRERYCQADKLLDIISSEMDGPPPWQIIIVGDPEGKVHSNDVIFDPSTALAAADRTPEKAEPNGKPEVEPNPAPTPEPKTAPEPEPNNDALIAQMVEWRNDPKWRHYRAHTDRWDKALVALGAKVQNKRLRAMRTAEARGYANRGWQRWIPVADALEKIEANAK